VIVVDASAALSALLRDGAARAALAADALHAPHLADSEVAHALRRRVAAGALDADVAWTALDTWRRLGITRHAATPYLKRIWALRTNASAYDATYVGLAEALGCNLLTADARLSRTPGVRCPVTLVPD
jgi:predicted nucleic acid-binding protein